MTRDIAKEVPTDGMWVDVISTNKKDRKDGRWDFNYFTVELFRRITRPEYPPDASKELKKYITWQTACKDIENHRKQGHRGSKYRICPQLVNINKDKFTMEEAVWSFSLERWVLESWFDSGCERKEKKVPFEPQWEYEIRSVKKI